jgi:hypothetical protein
LKSSQGDKNVNIIRRIIVGLAGVVVIALAIELAAPRAVHAIVSTLVTVTNTPNVNVVNTPTVSATINGTPTVNVGGSVNATIANTVANPLPALNVNDPGAQPYEKLLCVSTPQSCSPNSVQPPLTTTSGAAVKRLVIEEVSGNCVVNSGVVLWVELSVTGNSTVNGDNYSGNLFVPHGTGAGNFVYSARTRIYVDPGAEIQAYFSPTGGEGACSMHMNGYLVTQ